jgi:hypothetical protein
MLPRAHTDLAACGERNVGGRKAKGNYDYGREGGNAEAFTGDADIEQLTTDHWPLTSDRCSSPLTAHKGQR